MRLGNVPFELVRRQVAKRILELDPRMMESDVDVVSFSDDIARGLVLEWRAFVHELRETTRETETEIADAVQVPRTWWDALKLRWFPRWLLNRVHPVEMRTINVKTINRVEKTIVRLCPHLRTEPPATHLRFFCHECQRRKAAGWRE